MVALLLGCNVTSADGVNWGRGSLHGCMVASLRCCIGGWRPLKLGKFFGKEKPEFQGAVERAGYANAGDAALDGGIEEVLIFPRNGVFENEKSVAQTIWKQRVAGEGGGERIEITFILRSGQR